MHGPPSPVFRELDRLLAGEVSVGEFEARVYRSLELEDELGAAAYLDLLAFDYRQPHADVPLEKLVEAIYEHHRPGSLMRDRAYRLACGLLDGSIPLHLAIRTLAALSHQGRWIGSDFVGISSELDDLPGPDDYPLWDPDALAQHLPGWKEREAALTEAAVEAARDLLRREFADWPCPAPSPHPHAA
jgi:hypothetical protein